LDSVVAKAVEPLGHVRVPTLVAVGSDDERAHSADELVALLPRGIRAVVPGDHRTVAAAPEFVAAVADFLATDQ
jgi:pimeloyl-ACP methyl ester carboxylesterase